MTREITAPPVTPSDAPDEGARLTGVLAKNHTLPLWADPDPERAYLVLDEDGRLSVAVGHASEGSALPVAFAYGACLRWLIAEAPSEVDLAGLRNALVPGGSLYDLITAVVEGHSHETDRLGREIGILTDEASEASYEIKRALEDGGGSGVGLSFITERTTAPADEVLPDVGISLTGRESDADLEAMAVRLEDELADTNFVVAGVLDWLRNRRDVLC